MRRDPRDELHGDAGGVTAEFAVALPAVAIVLATCVGGLQLAAVQVRLQDAAALVARAAARGDDTAPAERIVPGVAFSVSRDGELVCATASMDASWVPGLPGATSSARSCAFDAGR